VTIRFAVAVCISLFIFAAPSHAVQRTFVSGASGVDSNPCSLSFPCRSFAAAMTFTDAGGEVIVLDSAGYGPVAISQSVSIISPLGVYAGISSFTGNAIEINSLSSSVTLRGLFINGQGGTTGVRITNATVVHIENVVVNGFTGNGIAVIDSLKTFIDDSIVRNCAGAPGILVAPDAVIGTVSIDHTRVEYNGWGIAVDAGTSVTIRDSVAAGNQNTGIWFRNTGALTRASGLIENTTVTYSGNQFDLDTAGVLAQSGALVVARNTTANHGANGFWARESTAGTEMVLDGCNASDNVQHGIIAGASGTGTALLTVSNSLSTNNGSNGIVAGSNGTVRAFANTVTRNTWGINGQAGTFESLGHNAVRGNGTDALQTIVSVPTM
jgi:hypothetical protein